MSKILIHIDELVVHGAGSLDPAVLQQALQRALGDQIAAGGIPAAWQQGATIPQVQAAYPKGTINAERVGQQTAQLIYGGKT